MRHLISRTIGLLTLVALVGACAPKEEVIVTANARMSGEELALAGEQLLSPYTFMLADTIFKEALKKDPDNYRAQFYSALLKPIMTLKGIHARLRPYVRANGDIKAWEGNLEKDLPNSALKNFVLRGSEDINTSKEIQDLLVEYREALVDQYKFLKKTQGAKFTLNIPINLLSENLWRQDDQYCHIIEDDIANGGEARVECDRREVLQRRVIDADNIAMRQYIGAQIFYLIIYTTYSAEGIEQLMEAGRNHEMTDQEVAARMAELPKLGTLRKDHRFNFIKTMGSDTLAAYRMFLKRQAELCPGGNWGAPVKRRGNLFEHGICIEPGDDETERSLAMIESILDDKSINIEVTEANGNKRMTDVNPSAWLNSPVRNVRQLMPATFNACGEGTSLADKTFGGLFPRGDAEPLVLKQECN